MANNDLPDFTKSQSNLFDYLATSLNSFSQQIEGFMQKESAKSAEFLKKITETHHAAMQSMTASVIEGISSALKPMQEETEKVHKKGGDAAEGHKSKLHDLIDEFKNGLSPTSLFGEAVGFVSKNFETISWGLIINSARQLSVETSSIFRSIGGNQAQLNAFTSQLAELSVNTGLSSSKIIDLGKAFMSEGMSLDKNVNPSVQAYLEVAGQAVDLFGISTDAAAKFTKQMKEEGFSAVQVKDGFDDLYKTMQINSLTVEDLGSSIVEASSIMQDFGAISSKSVNGLAQDLLETKALFKSMGIDARNAGKDISAVLENRGLREQQASFVASMTGMNRDQAYVTLEGPEGQKARLNAALEYASRSFKSGTFADQSKLSYAQQSDVSHGISYGLESAARASGSDQKELEAALKPYLEWTRSGHTGSYTEFQTERTNEEKAKNAPGTFNYGLKQYNDSFGKLSERLTHTLDAVLIILGGPLMKVLNPMIDALNFFLDGIVKIVDTPWIQPLIIVGELAVGLAGAFGTMMTVLTFIGSGTLPAFASILGAIGTTMAGLVAPVALVVGGLALLGGLLYNFSPQFKKFVDGIGDAVGGFMKNPTQALMQAGPILDMFFDRLWNFFGRVVSGIGDTIKNLFSEGTIKNISDGIGNIGDWVSNIAKHFGIGQAVSDIGNAAKQAGNAALKAGGNALGFIANAADVLTKGQPAEAAALPPLAGAASANAFQKAGINTTPFGWLSGKYESGRAGTVGDGTINPYDGIRHWAYGAWQFDHVAHTPDKFLASIKNSHPEIYSRLHPLLSSESQGPKGAFGQEWKKVGAESPELFKNLQREFAKSAYLSPLEKRFGSALNDPILKEVAFSTSIQHGQGGAQSILKHAGLGTNIATPDLINKIYQARDAQTHGRHHSRYTNESHDALIAELKQNNNLLQQVCNNQTAAMAQHGAATKKAERQAQLASAGSNVQRVNQAVSGNVL